LREEGNCVENKLLRIKYGPKKDDARGAFKKIHNEELQNLYSSPNIVKVIKDDMGGSCSTL
jgi:hypothetical protein